LFAYENEEYLTAINTINKLQESILEDIAMSIKKPLKEFMPKINNIKLQIAEEERRDKFHSSIDIIVDDGNPTKIEYKGDGVKSLAAIALLKESALKTITPIIIIEEPESHLHPEAINQLNTIIESLAESNQVIVTTHNPLFVVRNDITKNIIINDGTAKSAKNLKEIRDVLGIRASDNLINSKYVLVVEGTDDKEALMYILPKLSEKIGKALRANLLNVHDLGGASNLSYKLSSLKNTLYTYSVLLDDDSEGRKAYEKAEKDNLIKAKDVTFTTCIGMVDAEFEDCLKPDVYVKRITDEYNVNLLVIPDFRKNGKWSDRVKCSFKKVGKPWNDGIEQNVKNLVVEEIKNKNSIDDIFIPTKKAFIEGLVVCIENMIAEI
jgi:putative ATP-dependent endonuclease of OLD family